MDISNISFSTTSEKSKQRRKDSEASTSNIKTDSNLDLNDKLEISFESNMDLFSFSVFILLSDPHFLNFNHSIEYVCFPNKSMS